ncbi:MAG: Divalent metal cation transporter MntH [Actinomycetota bacterium]|jgi:Mn2+/Fe2+ NRAMP family transporter
MDGAEGTPRHHRHREHLRGSGYFRRIGPGLVTGAADDDPSGIGTYAQVGAASGYGLLWTTVVALPLAAAVQESTARLGLVTGRGLAALVKSRFPRSVLLVAVGIVAVANTFNIGADIGSMAAATRLVVPLPQALLVVLFTALMASIEIVVPYRSYSRILRWLCLSIASYLVVLFFIDVSWTEVLRRTFVPDTEFSRPIIAAVIALFGTTISPYLFFWQGAEEVEEIVADGGVPSPTPGHMGAMRGDVVLGMSSGVLVMFAIMVTSAATIGADGPRNISTAQEAARALRPFAGDLAGLLFTLGIVGVGLLAVPVLAGSTAYAVSEAFGWREGLGLKLRQARAFYVVILASMVGGFLVTSIGVNPVRALYLAAILNGVAAPPLIVLIALLARSRDLMGEHASGRVSQSLVWVAAIISAALPVAWLLAG